MMFITYHTLPNLQQDVPIGLNDTAYQCWTYQLKVHWPPWSEFYTSSKVEEEAM